MTVAAPNRDREGPDTPRALRVSPPDGPRADAPTQPIPRLPALLEAREGQPIAAVEGHPPGMGKVPGGSRQIDITIDPSSFAAPSRNDVAPTVRSVPDAGEEEDDNDNNDDEVWFADDGPHVDWRRFRLRGRTVGSLGTSALTRADWRIKRRFLDRTLRRLT